MSEVKNIPFDPEQITTYPRTHTDDRYKNSSLKIIGPSFMTWDEDGSAGRFSVNYEEVVYVVEGDVALTFYPESAEPKVITGVAGDVITIASGSNLDYSGTKGSKIFVVFSPLNWEELLDVTRG